MSRRYLNVASECLHLVIPLTRMEWRQFMVVADRFPSSPSGSNSEVLLQVQLTSRVHDIYRQAIILSPTHAHPSGLNLLLHPGGHEFESWQALVFDFYPTSPCFWKKTPQFQNKICIPIRKIKLVFLSEKCVLSIYKLCLLFWLIKIGAINK